MYKRILLAYDGSPGSQQALALAGALAWPEGSSIRVVLVVEPTLAALGPTGSPGAFIPAPELDEAVMAAQRTQVDEAVRTLARDGWTAEGAVVIGRTQVRPFTDRQISLLETFADQAVIAIENVRLFTELDARNAALTEALDQQTAQAMKVLAAHDGAFEAHRGLSVTCDDHDVRELGRQGAIDVERGGEELCAHPGPGGVYQHHGTPAPPLCRDPRGNAPFQNHSAQL